MRAVVIYELGFSAANSSRARRRAASACQLIQAPQVGGHRWRLHGNSCKRSGKQLVRCERDLQGPDELNFKHHTATAEQRHGKEEALAKCARALARGGGAGTASGVQLLQLDRHGFGHGVTGKVVRQDPASFPDIGSNGDRQRFAAGRGQNSGICRDCVAQWG